MPIKATCDECFTTLSVGSQHAGKIARCKTCGAKVRIPAAGEEEEELLSSGQALSSDEDEVPAPRRSQPKPAAARKKKPVKKTDSDGTSGKVKSVLVAVFVIGLFGLRFAGRMSKHWKAYQERQAQNGAPQFSGGAQPAEQQSPTTNASMFDASATTFGAPAQTADASALYSLTDSPIQPPTFSPATFREIPTSHAKAHLQSVPTPGASPGTLMTLGVYLPPGEHEPGSLPCILFAPAGTPLIHGNPLDGNPENPEFAPYVRAGFAVVEFSLDGWYDRDNPSDAAAARAYLQFSAANAGVKNADAAFRFAKTLPSVNPKQIYIAGHSSAGTLALLYAAHQPELAGCIAYAPQVDVEGHLREALSDPRADTALPGIRAFVKRSSPDSHISQIKVPVFAFHATRDDVTSCAKTRQFCGQLQQSGGIVKFVEVPGDDHYQTMISPGLKNGIEWVASRGGSVRSVAADAPATPSGGFSPSPAPADVAMTSPFRPARGMSEPASPASSPFRPVTATPEPASIVPPAPTTEPPQTTMVEAESSLEVGKRVLAPRGAKWMGAEVMEVLPGERVKVHFLSLPAAFDAELPWSHVRLPMAEAAIGKDDVETLRYNLVRVPQGGVSTVKQPTEDALLALEGYLPDSLDIDVRNKRVSLKVVKGSAAESEAMLALVRGQLFVTPFTPTRRR
ncbi:Alpha/beta hydrolase family protein [Caulifigura coniformis]|uniref:Alpha/beta hydrolase family protein n=1 Tax=Caulifigura coniformis TaxID=2527983 RepID=A0A517SJK4_9PLAN|nr:dienelactone hydrolase family protein [Caulifigura coniformis]QDT56297.1 Alpha/beta hydrolase family protein [Caulifigura coniformis]